MSREAFGDPPESQEPPDLCPVCGNDWHAEDCEFGKEVALRLKAERDAHKLAYALENVAMMLRKCAHRLRVNGHEDLSADAVGLLRRLDLLGSPLRNEAKAASGCKTPAGCRENGCLGWCDEHKPPVATRCDGCAELRDQLREKAAWCDELERDAERYRFVRTADKVGISAEAARDPVAYDAAIDRAMERAKI